MNIVSPRLEKLADFGTSEPWVARIWLGLSELVEFLDLSELQKGKLKDAINEIAEELSSAFISVRKIRNLEINEAKTVLEIKKEYSDLYDHLWRCYKDRFQTAIKVLGYEIGFLFKDDAVFEKESLEFIKNNPEIPDKLRKMLKIDRRIWQNGLSDFRNKYIQHRQVGKEIESLYYNLEVAGTTFNNVWQTIEDTFTILIETKLVDLIAIDEIHESKRDPKCPRRFKITVKNQPEF